MKRRLEHNAVIETHVTSRSRVSCTPDKSWPFYLKQICLIIRVLLSPTYSHCAITDLKTFFDLCANECSSWGWFVAIQVFNIVLLNQHPYTITLRLTNDSSIYVAKRFDYVESLV